MNCRTHMFIDLSLVYLDIALVLDFRILRIHCATVSTICPQVDDKGDQYLNM